MEYGNGLFLHDHLFKAVNIVGIELILVAKSENVTAFVMSFTTHSKVFQSTTTPTHPTSSPTPFPHSDIDAFILQQCFEFPLTSLQKKFCSNFPWSLSTQNIIHPHSSNQNLVGLGASTYSSRRPISKGLHFKRRFVEESGQLRGLLPS